MSRSTVTMDGDRRFAANDITDIRHARASVDDLRLNRLVAIVDSSRDTRDDISQQVGEGGKVGGEAHSASLENSGVRLPELWLGSPH